MAAAKLPVQKLRVLLDGGTRAPSQCVITRRALHEQLQSPLQAGRNPGPDFVRIIDLSEVFA